MTNKNFYTLEKIYPITMADYDSEYRLKPSSLLNLLQDMGARNISNTPFGNKELNAQNLGWFLVRYRIEFDKYPQNMTEIKFYTENRGTQRQSAYRDFEAYSTEGKRLMRASTYWLMVDLNDKSLVNIEEKFPDIKKYEKRDDDLILARLKPLKEWDYEKTFHIRYSDLDMNGHVNNIVYMSWAVEALDLDFLKKYSPKNIDIYFKHEVKYGEDVLSQVKITDNITEHAIRNSKTSEDLCLIKIEWQE